MCGLQSEPILKALLAKADLTLDKLAQSREAAAKKKKAGQPLAPTALDAIHLVL